MIIVICNAQSNSSALALANADNAALAEQLQELDKQLGELCAQATPRSLHGYQRCALWN